MVTSTVNPPCQSSYLFIKEKSLHNIKYNVFNLYNRNLIAVHS